MKYYELHKSTNLKEIGVYPQAGLCLEHNKNDAESPTKLKSLGIPPVIPNFSDLKINKQAHFTDFVSCGLVTYGMFLSDKMYSIFLDFNIQHHKVYKLDIKNADRNYLWVHFLTTQILETIDYSKSEFRIYEFGFEKDLIALSDFGQYKLKQQEINNMSVIKATKLYLQSEPKYDLFIIPFLDGNIYVKEQLARRIEKMKITGIKLKPSNLTINKSSR